jgi:hypothetical protein
MRIPLRRIKQRVQEKECHYSQSENPKPPDLRLVPEFGYFMVEIIDFQLFGRHLCPTLLSFALIEFAPLLSAEILQPG